MGYKGDLIAIVVYSFAYPTCCIIELVFDFRNEFIIIHQLGGGGVSVVIAMARIEILGSWARPFSNRVEMALNLKSIPYDLIEGKSLFTHMIKSDRLVCLNPVHKKIPILIHGGMPVCESLIILEYIHDTWTGSGPSILPSDLFDHSLARFWASNLDDKVTLVIINLSQLVVIKIA